MRRTANAIQPGTRLPGGYVIVRRPRGRRLGNLLLLAIGLAAAYTLAHSPQLTGPAGTVTSRTQTHDSHGWHYQLVITAPGTPRATVPVSAAAYQHCPTGHAYPACTGN